MAKKKKRQKNELKSWCSARFASGSEPFVPIGKSLLKSPAFVALKASSRIMYLTMALICRGKEHFKFTRRQEQRYCKIAPKTAVDCKQELEVHGFIASAKGLYKPTEFTFSGGWKAGAAAISGKKYTQPWLSATNGKAEEDVLMVGLSLFECDQFQKLSYLTRLTYLAMAMEAGSSPRFMFPPAKAKEYGIKKSSLNRAEKELEAGQFIEKDPDALTTPGAYKFNYLWKCTATIRGKAINPRRPIQD